MVGSTATTEDVREPWTCVNHPAFPLAIAVLVANDRVFEPTWPGPVTGKLSDVAGLFLLGAIGLDVLDRVEARARRRWAIAAVAALLFTAVKTSAAVAGVAVVGAAALLDVVGAAFGGLPAFPSDGDGAQIVADPTDLLALPALALPLLLRPPRPGRRGVGTRDSPPRPTAAGGGRR